MSFPPVNSRQSVQCDVQCAVQSEPAKAHYFLDESRRGRRNPAYDEPIPYRLARDVERGAELEEIEPEGFVS